MHKQLLENIASGVIQVSLNGNIEYVNAYTYTSLGLKESGDLVGNHYSEINWLQFDQNGDALKKEDSIFFRALAITKNIDSLTQGIDIQGVRKWFTVSASPLIDKKNVTGAVVSFKELASRDLLEGKNDENSGRYKMLLENIDAVVWESGFSTKTFTYISPKVESLFGFPQNEWLKEGFWQSRIYEFDREHVLAYENQKALDVENYQLEYRLVNSDEELVWIRDSVEVVRDGDKPIMLRGMMFDITDQKNSRSQLRESEKRFRELIDEAPYAITVYDNKGTLIAANSRCEAYWMLDLKAYVGTFNIFDNNIFVEESQKEEIQKAFNGKSGEITSTIYLPQTDREKTFKIKYYPLIDSEGALENVIYFSEDITQFIQAGEDIRYEESLKQGVLDALDQAILVIDEKGKIINFNKRLKFYISKTQSKTVEVGAMIFDFMKFLDDKNLIQRGLQSILNREIKVLDHEMKMADDKWYSLRATPLDEPFGAVITWQNINTRKEIEMALEKSLRKYRNIYNKAPVMMHSINDKLEIISVSDFWLEKMGYERNEVIGKSPADFLADKSKESITVNLKKLFSDGFVKNAEYTYRKKDGDEIEVLLSAVAEYDEDGNFERSITGMLDVTELKNTERKLQESQAKLLESQRISKIANYEFDVNSRILTASDEMITMMGLPDSTAHFSITEDLIHPEDLAGFKDKLNQYIEQGKDFFYTYRIIHMETKSLKWVSDRGKMVKDEHGNTIKIIGTVQNISDQKQAEQKIKRLSDRVLLATEIANLGVWEYDRETDEVFWEDQMYAIFSGVKTPLTFTQLQKYFLDEDLDLIDSSLQMVKNGINFLETEVRIKNANEIKYLRAFTRVLRDHNGRLKGMVGVVYDISTDKSLQKQLENSLEEKNVLIKEVHHRVKNNMQLISSILALKSYELDSEKSKVIFEEINDRIKAMAIIHDKLYTFYNVSEIDISEYLSHLAHELQTILLSANFSIKVESDMVVFDVEKALLIGLIVSEMVGNAVKHGFKNRLDGLVTITFSKDDDGYLLRVINNGDPIQADVINSSTGLGISLIKTFTKQLGGTLQFDSENGLKVHF